MNQKKLFPRISDVYFKSEYESIEGNIICITHAGRLKRLYIREGRSAQRDLAVFNIAQFRLYIRGAIEKNHSYPAAVQKKAQKTLKNREMH